MTRPWRWTRHLVGVAILAVLLWQVGVGPFLVGFGKVDGWSLAAATVLTVLTTVCSAWRWSIVARGLGVPIRLRAAVAAYYRSLFLNTMLPGGVLGDVERGVRHGRRVGDTGAALRTVVWERVAGQSVQVALALAVLLLFPSPWQPPPPLAALATLGLGVGAVVVTRIVRREGAPGRDVCWVVLASTGAVAGHVLTLLVAARTAGTVATPTLVPIVMLLLLAMSVPLSVAGWGPREGVAAWAFAAAGLGAAQGVAVAVVYGVMGFVATLPGAVLVAAPALPELEGAARA